MTNTRFPRSLAVAFAALAAFATLSLSACGGYYQVTDNASGKSYYTRDVDRDDGHVRFRDTATGDDVTLDNSEISEVTEQQYKNATGKK